jgi:cytochrome P450
MTATEVSEIEITKWKEIREAWTHPLLESTNEHGPRTYAEGTLVTVDGEEHKVRRRAMSRLLTRGGHSHFRDAHLRPTAATAIDEVRRNPSSDGLVHVDIRRWAQRVNQQLAAALVGFDVSDSPERTDELFALVEAFIAGVIAMSASIDNFDPDGAVERAGKEAHAEIGRRFYTPALQRRRALVDEVKRGAMTEEDMPHDFLSLVALERDPAWEDDELAKREAIFLLGAGVHTTSNGLVWTLRELFDYFERHPEEQAFRNDEEFLLGAASESLRLHPVTPGRQLVATDDFELCEGTVVTKGTRVVIRADRAGLEEGFYGEDGLEFNPRRVIPGGHPPWGLAFGMGVHMCFGAPIVVGNEGIDGSLMVLLQTCMKAGVRPDPDHEPYPVAQWRGVYDAAGRAGEYFVAFPPL